jgi:hypothetical protein
MAVLSRIKVLQLQSHLGDAWFDATDELRRFCPRQSSWMMGLFLLMSVGVAPSAVSATKLASTTSFSAFCKQDHQVDVAILVRLHALDFERCPADMLGAIANLSRTRRSTIALIFLKNTPQVFCRFSG